MNAEVVTFGETMARLTAPSVGPLRHMSHLDLGIAGAESNVAIGLARLGVAVHWAGRVGNDEFGELIARTLRAERVGTDAIVDLDAPTGLLVKERRTSTTTRVQYYRASSAGSRITPGDLRAELIADATVLHVTGVTAAISASGLDTCRAAIRMARESSVEVSFDLNFRRRLWSGADAAVVLRELASISDIVFATAEEARMIVPGETPGELARAIAALGPREVLIKSGADGAEGFLDGEWVHAPPLIVREVDPVGAGDAFTAGYLMARCSGKSAEQRIEMAARCGATVVEVEGDWEGALSLGDLESYGVGEVVR